MNNKELLIQIIIELRSNGITNKKLLNLIEKMPPHYFIDIFKKYKILENISLEEIINIAKIFNFLLNNLKKIDNFLISGVNSGWSAYIASEISKRVYCLSYKEKDKTNLNFFLKERNISNVFLKKGKNLNDWSMVAPFDAVLAMRPVKEISELIVNNISERGFLFIPIFKKNNIEMVRINQFDQVHKTDLDYNLLNSNIL